jgi:hypothetical protein
MKANLKLFGATWIVQKLQLYQKNNRFLKKKLSLKKNKGEKQKINFSQLPQTRLYRIICSEIRVIPYNLILLKS